MTDIQLPVRSVMSALRASHERLVSDILVQGDPDYPFPQEDYLEFANIRWENSWQRERERASWTVPDEPFHGTESVEVSVGETGTQQSGLGDFA